MGGLPIFYRAKREIGQTGKSKLMKAYKRYLIHSIVKMSG
jgi:hypothetical protein